MIKAKDEHVFDTTDNGGRVHIYGRGNAYPLCGAGFRRKNNTTSNDAKGSECCTNCLRIARKRGLIEEVPEHIAAMPKGYRIMEVGEVITGECMAWEWGKGPWAKFVDLPNSQHRIGEAMGVCSVHLCCPVDAQKQAEVIDKPAQDPIKVKLHEYECRAKAAEDEVAELKSTLASERGCISVQNITIGELQEKLKNTEVDRDDLAAANDELNEDDAKQVELVCRLGREVTELKETVKRLERANHHQQDNLDELEKERDGLKADMEITSVTLKGMCKERNSYLYECQDYRKATNGHTLEAIKTIMQAMPSPEDLEGYELRWGMPKKGESFVEALKGQTLWGVATADFDSPMARWLIRTPIVEYIPTEEIVDELAKQRPQAQFRDNDCNEWSDTPYMLVHVRTDLDPNGPYIDDWGNKWRHCRIKRSTIERLRGAK